LRSNRQTVFGIKHHFQTIHSAREYQERVPLSTYEDYIGAISLITGGGKDVLTSSRVRLFEPTSGSTRGAKLIPFTNQLQEEIRRAVAPWIVDLARSEPALIGGPAYWSISPVADLSDSSESKIPVGFETDSAYLGGWFQSLVNKTLIQCDDLRRVSNIEEFRRRTLLRLLAARNLRLISVWHPTFLTLLLETLVSSWPRLLSSLRNGLPGQGAAKAMAPCLRRAAELERADPRQPMTIWPELKVISCWGDAQASSLLRDLSERFPNVRIQPKGLIATEAFVSVPFQGLHPVAVRSHFFEFIDDAGSAKFLWELEEAKCYSVVVTTGGGLYRYRLRDRIRVTGFLEQTPSIRFIGKEDGVSDLYGEKLSDSFIAEILTRLLPEFAPETRFSLLAPEHEGRATRYVLFIDSLASRPLEFAERLESELRGNPHYAYCVHLGQLLPATIAPIERGSDRLYLAKLQADGARLGNIKPTALSAAMNWRQTFSAKQM
jgi:hypothetical protein